MRSFLTYVIAIAITILTLCSCQDDFDIKSSPSYETPISTDSYFYPKVQAKSRVDAYSDWENWQTVILNSGNCVNTPWNRLSTASEVPTEFLTDIKYVDGWELILSTVKGPNGTNRPQQMDRNVNYMVFHNIYTGILKVFYYNESIAQNNNAFWEIYIDKPNSHFAFFNKVSTLYNERKTGYVVVNNLSTNISKGFSQGWNCFMVELAYDPAQSGTITFRPVNMQTANINFTGELSMSTTGVVVSSMTNDHGVGKLTNGISRRAGEEGAKWVSAQISKDKFLGISKKDLTNGIKGILTSGATALLDGFVGLFSTTENSTKSIYLDTNGTFKANGSMVCPVTGILSPLKMTLNKDSVGYLGAWCLTQLPTIYYSAYALLKDDPIFSNGYTFRYRVNMSTMSSGYATINPDLKKRIKNYSFKTEFYEVDSVTRRDAFGTRFGISAYVDGDRQIKYNKLYTLRPGLVMDVALKDKWGEILPRENVIPPYEIYIPDVPNGPKGACGEVKFTSSFIAIKTLTMTTDNGDIAQSVHHCIPLVSWDYDELSKGFYWSLYPNEPVETVNWPE